MKSILEKIKANKFRSVMIGACIFLFGFISVTIFSNINDTYAIEVICPVGWYSSTVIIGSASACCPASPQYEYDGKQCSLAGSIGEKYETCPYGKRGSYGTCWISALQPQEAACYACGGGSQGSSSYKWGNYSNSSYCSKVSKTKAECTGNVNNGACYLCGNSRNGVYRWGNYDGSSSCVRQNFDMSTCLSKNSRTLSATFNVTDGGTLNGSSSASCTTTQENPNSCKTTAPTATRSGYSLKGWSTSSTCASIRTANGDNSITLDNSFNGNLYSCWSVNSPSPSDYNPGSFTAETPGEGSGGSTGEGSETTEDINAYTRSIYKVTYDTNGGKFIDGTTTRVAYVPSDAKVGDTKTLPIKDNMKFKEWQLNGTKFDSNQKPTSDITLKAVYEELTDDDKLYYCESGILEYSTQTCYNVMKQDESKKLYNYTLYSYKDNATFCYGYNKDKNKSGGVYFRANNNDFNMNDYLTTTGKNNADYTSYGYPNSEAWVSNDTCQIGTVCNDDTKRSSCEVRWDAIVYSQTGILIKNDETKENETTVTDDDNNKNSDSNPKTGDALILVAWIIGIGALGYTVYYFKTKKQEN